MMFGFKKHCPICGMDINKEIAITRFGKHLCSESCADKYVEQKQEVKKIEEERRKHPRRGGCC